MKSDKASADRLPQRLPRLVRPALTVIGGLFAFGLLAVLNSGTASADEQDNHPPSVSTADTRSPVAELLGGALRPVTPLVHNVSTATAPIVEPVVDVAAVLKPVVRPVVDVAEPLVQAVAPALKPVTEPVVAVVSPVLAPASERLGLDPVVSAVAPSTPSAPSVPVAVEQPAAPAAETAAVAPQPDTVVPPVVAVEKSTAPRVVGQSTVTGVSVAPVMGAGGPEPTAPQPVPALPSAGGSTGTVSSGSGGGVSSGVLPADRHVTADGSSWTRPDSRSDAPLWCHVLGKNHPS